MYQTIVVSTELSHPCPELFSTEYRDVQFSTDLSKSVPNCPVPSTEMSNSVPTCPSPYRNVQVPRCLVRVMRNVQD